MVDGIEQCLLSGCHFFVLSLPQIPNLPKYAPQVVGRYIKVTSFDMYPGRILHCDSAL